MPTYTENHAVLRFGGPAHNGAEIWSCGLRLKHLGGDEMNALRQETIDTLPAVAQIVSDYVTSVDTGFSANVTLAYVKLDAISKSTGQYGFPNNPNTLELVPPVTGTASPLPPQVAYAVTLRGLFNRGPAARGRWYVPCGNLGTQTDGRMNEAAAIALADAAGVFLAALSSVDSGAGPDAWAPWLFGDGITGPRDSVIELVQVGRVYDTQRRRRNSLDEAYTDSTTYPV